MRRRYLNNEKVYKEREVERKVPIESDVVDSLEVLQLEAEVMN